MFNWKRNKVEEAPLVLDESYLARLARHLGDEILREILSDGLLELSDRLSQLDDAMAQDDAEAVRKIVHDITGMVGHLGLSRLSRNAADSERMLREGVTSVEHATEDLRATVPESLGAVRYFLDGTSAD